MSQQHDGLVVVGLPENAAVQAREASGLRYASVREKRYHPDLPVLGLDERAEEGPSRPDVPADA